MEPPCGNSASATGRKLVVNSIPVSDRGPLDPCARMSEALSVTSKSTTDELLH